MTVPGSKMAPGQGVLGSKDILMHRDGGCLDSAIVIVFSTIADNHCR